MSDFQIENGVLVKYTGNGRTVVIPDSVTAIGVKAFKGCSSLMSITISDSVTSIGDEAFLDCSRLTSITIPDSVTSIGDNAFWNCSRLTSITIPDSVTSIGDNAFWSCSRLTSITIPDSVTLIGEGAFSDCSRLTSVTIPDSVTSIGESAFEGCRNLTSITIPDSVTSIGEGAFLNCSRLTSVTIPDSVTSIGGWAFHDCKGLADKKTGLVIIGHTLCEYVGNAKSIVIPDSVTSIGARVFEDCSRLTSITIPDSVTLIGEGAFSGCSSLTSITIPDSVTSIGNSAFWKCSSLTSINVPDSVTSIGKEVFSTCTNLKEFTCPSSFAKQLQTILPKAETPIILHIPDISDISAKFRPGAAVGFAEDNRDCTDENSKKYIKYIKANAAKLAGLATEHPTLFYLMLREKLISAKDLDAFTKAVQDNGNTELIAAILDYANSGVPEKDKAKVQQKKETLDTNVTNFLFDATKMEKISGKTFAVTGKLKTFANRDELKACLDACGATLTESLSRNVNYLITNTPDSDTAKNREAESLGIPRITEAQFNEMVGRKV